MDIRRRMALIEEMGGGGGAVSTLIVSDTFTDADDTSLDAHAIAPTNTPATAWAENVGNWKITSGKAVLADNLNNSIATVSPGIADCIVIADVKSATTVGTFDRASGIILRYLNSSNYWSVYINAADDLFGIMEVNGGVQTVRDSASVFIETSIAYTIAVNVKGAVITATLDGAHEITYDAATLNQTEKKHGIKARTAGTDTIDNFKLWTNP